MKFLPFLVFIFSFLQPQNSSAQQTFDDLFNLENKSEEFIESLILYEVRGDFKTYRNQENGYDINDIKIDFINYVFYKNNLSLMVLGSKDRKSGPKLFEQLKAKYLSFSPGGIIENRYWSAYWQSGNYTIQYFEDNLTKEVFVLCYHNTEISNYWSEIAAVKNKEGNRPVMLERVIWKRYEN